MCKPGTFVDLINRTVAQCYGAESSDTSASTVHSALTYIRFGTAHNRRFNLIVPTLRPLLTTVAQSLDLRGGAEYCGVRRPRVPTERIATPKIESIITAGKLTRTAPLLALLSPSPAINDRPEIE